jgi:hypothetical protein
MSVMMQRIFALVLATAAVGCAAESRDEETDYETLELDEPNLIGVSPEKDEANARIPHALRVRSGELAPGEEESGPFPDPWQRMGPFPDPWQSGSSGGGSGSSSDGSSGKP